MKRILTLILLFALPAGALICLSTGCKKTEEALTYTLAVTVYDGVTGTPQTGDYYQAEGDQVEYSYTLADGYNNLIVAFDNVQVEPSGTVTITGAHTLKAYASEGTGDFLLTVSTGPGVAGTPEEGFYYYDAGEQVDYEYSIEDGYTNLRVTLDGVEIDSTGTITISQEHTLYVFADKEFYIQGSWTLQEAYYDGSSFSVNVTFTGETRTGTVADSDGGVGTYTVDGSSVVFTLVFPDVTYEYIGSFTEEESMGGDARRYTTATDYSSGSWAAAKNTGEPSAQVSHSKSKKGDR